MRIVRTKTYYHGLQYCIERLRQRKIDLDSPKIIIVPDRFSFETEEAIYSALEEKGAFDIEVLTLNRLSIRLDRSNETYLNTDGAVMAVARILESEREGLTYFRDIKRRHNTSKDIHNTIMQLQASGLKSEDIVPYGNDLLKKKLSDIKLIFSKYEEFTLGYFTDSSSRLRNAQAFIDKTDWLRNAEFFVLGFDRITKTALSFLMHLSKRSRGLTINTISTPIHNSGVQEDLIDELRREGEEYQLVDYEMPFESVFLHIYENFFSFPPKEARFPNSQKRVELYEADSSVMAAHHACRLISDYVFRHNYSFRDIGIVTGGLTELQRAAFISYGIPINSEERFSLKSHPFVKTLCSALDCIQTRYSKPYVLQFASSLYLGIDAERYATFDNYCEKYNIDYSRFESPFSLGILDAKGATQSDAVTAESVRKEVMERLKKLERDFKTAKTYSDFCTKCVDFLSAFSFEEFSYVEAGNEYISVSEQVPKKLERLFESLELAMGSEPATADNFQNILRCGIEALEAGLTPAEFDAVNIFSYESFRMKRYRVLIYLDCNEGVMPVYKSDSGLLTDSDIDEMSLMGQSIKPKIKSINRLSQAALFDTMFLADRLHLITSKPNIPAQMFLTLERILGLERNSDNIEKLSLYIPQGEEEIAEFLSYYTPTRHSAMTCFFEGYDRSVRAEQRTLSATLSTLFHYLNEGSSEDCSTHRADDFSRAIHIDDDKLIMPQRTFCLESGAEELFFSGKTISVSRLETYFRCPFEYFISYGLNANPRPQGRLMSFDVGKLLHYIAFRHVQIRKNNRNVDNKSTEELLNEYFSLDDFVRAQEPNKAFRSSILREAEKLRSIIDDDLNNSKYVPFEPELSFGAEGALLGIKLNAGKTVLELEGKIDRLDINADIDNAEDLSGRSIRVIDYKSGSANNELSGIIYGKKIQLPMYLRVLERVKGCKPAGAMYLPINNDFQREGARMSFEGWVVEDVNELRSMDTRLNSVSRSPILNVSIKNKDGKEYINSTASTLSTKQFDRMLDYCERLCSKALTEIEGGYIEPSPLVIDNKSPCKFCNAKNICYVKRERMAASEIKKDFFS